MLKLLILLGSLALLSAGRRDSKVHCARLYPYLISSRNISCFCDVAVSLNPKHKPIHFHRNPKAPQFRQDLLQGPSRNGEQPGDLELSTITPSFLLPNTVISEIVAQYIGDVV